MEEEWEPSQMIVETEKSQVYSVTTAVPQDTLVCCQTVTRNALVVGETTDSSAEMQNMEEEEASLGNSEMVLIQKECIRDVKAGTEEEIVKSWEPLFTPNANLDLAPLAAAYADLLSQTAKLLE